MYEVSGTIIQAPLGTALYEAGVFEEVLHNTSIIAPLVFSELSITKLDIPNNVEIIGAAAFKYCTMMKELTLNEGLVKIGFNAFKYTNLKEVTIPKSVISIGIDAFPVTVENFIIPKNLYKTGYGDNQDYFIKSIYSEPSIITSPVSITTY